MNIQQIQEHLARPAGTYEESWLGKVFMFSPDEDVPTNNAGQHLLSYAQLYLPGLPFTVPLLAGVRVLTVFISNPFPDKFEPIGDYWVIRD